MPKSTSYLSTETIKGRSRLLLPGSWRDYMGKSLPNLNGRADQALSECVDRARVLLQDYDSQRVAETIEIAEILLAIFYGEEAPLENATEVGERVTQKLFRRGEISEPLALAAALNRGIPVFFEANCKSEPRTRGKNPSSNGEPNWYGVSLKHKDSNALYLAALGLRDAFAAARIFMEASSYSSVSLDIMFNDDDDPNDVLTDCETEAGSLLEEVIDMCGLAAEKLARAVEAVSMAETIVSESIVKQRAEAQHQETVSSKVRQTISENASKAASARHAKYKELRKLAVDLYKKGSFRSTLQAAKHILPEVQAHAQSLGISLSADRGEKTVYDWLLGSN